MEMLRDTDLLTEYVRQRLSGYITNKYVENSVLNVITLDMKWKR